MPRISKAPPNTIVKEGVESFPINKLLIEAALRTAAPLSGKQLLEYHSDKYHGFNKPGCILVRTREELTYQDHYLNIYGCLTCGLERECLRSGWEIGWWNDTESKKLK